METNRRNLRISLSLMIAFAVLDGFLVAIFTYVFSMCDLLWILVSGIFAVVPFVSILVKPAYQHIFAFLLLGAALFGVFLSFWGGSLPPSPYDNYCLVWTGFLPADVFILLLLFLPSLTVFRVRKLLMNLHAA
jgi:hypothetical protein